ncbi:MAG TPA: metal ABC transporter permease [Candidatus Limnocylindria bacterium]|nr:metal ABC transporter permease [Candidatus Limnocylindria bacterium]
MNASFDWGALLGDANVRSVLLGSMLLGAGAGVLGCFTFLRKRALLGDALAHATLPGVCLAFLVTGSKHPFVLLVGATITGWLGVAAVNVITKRSRIKDDAALALTLSVFFGFGIVLLTRIQKTGAAAQAGLDKFLFGQAASLVPADVLLLGGVTVVLLACVVLAFKEFKLLAFDPQFAATIGRPVGALDFLLNTLTVLSVTVGLQAVGVVLMAAMLVTPAAAARYWTDRLPVMLVLAGTIGALAGAIGAVVSMTAPRMPTGPWTVVAATALFAVSLVAAPRRGVVARTLRRWRTRRRVAEENVLKTLYHLGESDGVWDAPRKASDVSGRRRAKTAGVASVLPRLANAGWVERTGEAWRLTRAGLDRARRVVRLHRLWEVYLTERLHLAADHVHDDAEEIEHILTPELEAQLEAALARPRFDPHRQQIPYDAPVPASAAEPTVVP